MDGTFPIETCPACETDSGASIGDLYSITDSWTWTYRCPHCEHIWEARWTDEEPGI